jgi:hypothetical protein
VTGPGAELALPPPPPPQALRSNTSGNTSGRTRANTGTKTGSNTGSNTGAGVGKRRAGAALGHAHAAPRRVSG